MIVDVHLNVNPTVAVIVAPYVRSSKVAIGSSTVAITITVSFPFTCTATITVSFPFTITATITVDAACAGL